MSKKHSISKEFLQLWQDEIHSSQQEDYKKALQMLQNTPNALEYLPKILPLCVNIDKTLQQEILDFYLALAKNNIESLWEIASDLVKLLSHKDLFVRRAVQSLLLLCIQEQETESSYLKQETKRVREQLIQWTQETHPTHLLTDSEILEFVKNRVMSQEERAIVESEKKRRLLEQPSLVCPTPPAPPMSEMFGSVPIDRMPKHRRLGRLFSKIEYDETMASAPASAPAPAIAPEEVRYDIGEERNFAPEEQPKGYAPEEELEKYTEEAERYEAEEEVEEYAEEQAKKAIPEEELEEYPEEQAKEYKAKEEIEEYELETPEKAKKLKKQIKFKKKCVSEYCPFKVVWNVFAKVFTGILFVFKWTYKKIGQCIHFVKQCATEFWKSRNNPGRAGEIPAWEKAVSEDIGHPGILERCIVQCKYLVQFFYYTFGLRFVAIITFFDIILSCIVEYIQAIFQSWRMMKTIYRRLKRRDPRVQLQGIIEDIAQVRWQFANIFHFSNFNAIHEDLLIENEDKKNKILGATFPLQTVLNIRDLLDQMQRDLNFVTFTQTESYLKNTIKDFLLGFIPRPNELFVPMKDLFLLIFFMKYSREQIEEMYLDVLISYTNIYNMLAKKNELDISAIELYQYEKDIVERLQKQDDFNQEIKNLSEIIEETHHKLQRLLQLLCYPIKSTNVYYWLKRDLLLELGKQNPYELYSLECERWLTPLVERELKNKMIPSDKELKFRLKEAKDLLKRYKLQKNIYSHT